MRTAIFNLTIISIVSAQPTASIAVNGQSRNWYENIVDIGQPAVVTLTLRDGVTPVTGADVQGFVNKIDGEDLVMARDNGTNGDITANDGIYTLVYTPTVDDRHTLTFFAQPPPQYNSPMLEPSLSFFAVPRRCLTVTGRPDGGVPVDMNNNGLFDVVRFSIPVVVHHPANFHFTLYLNAGRDTLVGTTYIDLGIGNHVVQVDIPARQFVVRSADQSYPIELLKIRQTVGRVTSDVFRIENSGWTTNVITRSQFERSPVASANIDNVRAVDTNGNGKFDEVEVVIRVHARQACKLKAFISIKASKEVIWEENGVVEGVGQEDVILDAYWREYTLQPGANQLVMKIADSGQIGQSKLNGPYVVEFKDFSELMDEINLVWKTQTPAWQASEFEGFTDAAPVLQQVRSRRQHGVAPAAPVAGLAIVDESPPKPVTALIQRIRSAARYYALIYPGLVQYQMRRQLEQQMRQSRREQTLQRFEQYKAARSARMAQDQADLAAYERFKQSPAPSVSDQQQKDGSR